MHSRHRSSSALFGALIVLTLLAGCKNESCDSEKPAPAKFALPIHALNLPIKLDGDPAKWAVLPGAYLDQDFDCIQGRAPAACDGAQVRMARDEQALYVSVFVDDGSVMNSGTPDTYWQGDCVELFLDVRPARSDAEPRLGAQQYSDGVHQLLLVPPTPDGQPVRWTEADHGAARLKDLAIAGKQTAGGYFIEIQIPYASLGVPAQRFAEPIGFSLFIDDVDAIPGGISAPVVYAWRGQIGAAQDASTFGLASESAHDLPLPAYALRLSGTAEAPALKTGVAVGLTAPSSAANLPHLTAQDQAQHSTLAGGLPFTDKTRSHPGLGVNVLTREWNITPLPAGEYSFTAGAERPELHFCRAAGFERYPVPDTLLSFNRKGYLQFSHDGRTWLVGLNRAAPVMVVIDSSTGASEVKLLPDGETSWSASMGPDGRIYIGTAEGSLLRYDPLSKNLETLQKRNMGGIVMALHFYKGRYLIWGAYPLQAGVYDLKEQKIISVFNPVDPVPPEIRYIQAIVEAPDGRVVLGGYRPGVHLILLDPLTGKREGKTPAALTDALPRDMFFTADGTFVISQGDHLLLYNYPSFELRKTVTIPAGAPVWLKGKLHVLNARTNEILECEDAGFSDWKPVLPDLAKALGSGWPIEGLDSKIYAIGANNDVLIAYDPSNGDISRKPLDIRGQIRTYALCVVPELHKIYGSPFLNQHFWEIDLDSKQGHDLGLASAGGGQVNDILWNPDLKRLYLASYTLCTVNAYDPSQAARYPDNPKEIARIGEEQMRPNGPHALVQDGRYLWMASSAQYSKLGGALSRIDPVDGSKQVWRNLAVDQTPNALVLDPQRHRIYLSTDIYADQDSIKPTQKMAKLVSFDTEKLEKVAEIAPFPHAPSLMAFCLVAPGRVLVRAHHRLFIWTPDTGEMEDMGPEPEALVDVIPDEHGQFIAASATQIGRLVLQPGRPRIEPFAPEGGNYLQVRDGKLWYINGQEVHGYRLPN